MTAVPWFGDQALNYLNDEQENHFIKVIQQALELEKQEMLHFWQGGLLANESGGKNFETYYNETYKK